MTPKATPTTAAPDRSTCVAFDPPASEVPGHVAGDHNPTGYDQILTETLGLGSGSSQLAYVWGHQAISQSQKTSQEAATTFFFLHDGHASTRALISAAGKMATASYTDNRYTGQTTTSIQLFTYDAYGNQLTGLTTQTWDNASQSPVTMALADATQAATRMLYSGQWTQRPYHGTLGYDVDSFQPLIQPGLQNLRGRLYESYTGRFDTRDTYQGDPWQPLTLNSYSYGLPNPVNYSDPSGMFSLGETLVSIGVISSINAILAFPVAAARRGIRAGVAASVGAFVGTSVGYSLMPVGLNVGPIGIFAAFGLGSFLGTMTERNIIGGWDYVWTPEGQIELAISTIVGGSFGLLGYNMTAYLAKDLSKRLLVRQDLIQEMRELIAEVGVHDLNSNLFKFSSYFINHPGDFREHMYKYLAKPFWDFATSSAAEIPKVYLATNGGQFIAEELSPWVVSIAKGLLKFWNAMDQSINGKNH